MKLTLTDEAIKNINKKDFALRQEANKPIWTDDVRVTNSALSGTSIVINGCAVTNIQNIDELIESLTFTKKAIEKVTGLVFD